MAGGKKACCKGGGGLSGDETGTGGAKYGGFGGLIGDETEIVGQMAPRSVE